jgi:hypothetical protein
MPVPQTIRTKPIGLATENFPQKKGLAQSLERASKDTKASEKRAIEAGLKWSQLSGSNRRPTVYKRVFYIHLIQAAFSKFFEAKKITNVFNCFLPTED